MKKPGARPALPRAVVRHRRLELVAPLLLRRDDGHVVVVTVTLGVVKEDVMKHLKWVTSLLSVLVVGTLVAGCDLLQSPAKPSATTLTQSQPPDLSLGNFVPSTQQGRESVDWTRFISKSAGPGQITALRFSAAGLAPGAPSNLTFNTASSTVSLSWNPPSSGDPATSYVVEAGSVSGLANVASFDTGSALTSLSVDNVPVGRYFVRVKARNGAGLSAPTNEVLIVVGGSCAVPAAPTNLRSCATSTTLSLTWSGSPGAASYILEAGSSPGASNLFASDIGSEVSMTATAPPGTYYIRLRAKSPCGASAPSNEIIVTVGSTPIVDQSFLPTYAPPNTLGLPTFNGRAQTFTVGMSGLLSDVALRFEGTYSNVRVQIRSTSGGIPTAQVLIDTRIPSTTQPTSGPTRISLASFGLCVDAGDVLAIVLPPVSAGNSVALWNIISGPNATYERGQGLSAADNGASSPINHPEGDFAFQTYVSR